MTRHATVSHAAGRGPPSGALRRANAYFRAGLSIDCCRFHAGRRVCASRCARAGSASGGAVSRIAFTSAIRTSWRSFPLSCSALCFLPPRPRPPGRWPNVLPSP